MTQFKVSGEMKIQGMWKPFSKIVDVETESAAKRRVYSLMGSNHHLTRQAVKIESVAEYKEEE